MVARRSYCCGTGLYRMTRTRKRHPCVSIRPHPLLPGAALPLRLARAPHAPLQTSPAAPRLRCRPTAKPPDYRLTNPLGGRRVWSLERDLP